MTNENEYPLQLGEGYVCFWDNPITNDHSDATDEGHFEFSFIKEKLKEIFQVPNSFIGVTDYHGNTIQFSINENCEASLDIPKPKEKGSMSKKTNLEEALSIIDLKAENFQTIKIDNLFFERW